ncbi:hypothetical protein JTE90_027257 [Oedothorax gibbosus]|uniref:Uncharacterized protein n=1 Tax=Oedothorax gibbosus TaxID=931172 RepID=A0AAV6TKX0_9ARAC|nr:hypothetical protein JTE90_027257 [Oedothorax gibbosus]
MRGQKPSRASGAGTLRGPDDGVYEKAFDAYPKVKRQLDEKGKQFLKEWQEEGKLKGRQDDYKENVLIYLIARNKKKTPYKEKTCPFEGLGKGKKGKPSQKRLFGKRESRNWGQVQLLKGQEAEYPPTGKGEISISRLELLGEQQKAARATH